MAGKKSVSGRATPTKNSKVVKVEAKKGKVATKPQDGEKVKKTGGKKVPTGEYATYIHRCLRKMNPEMSISKKSMAIMNSIVSDIFTNLCQESSRLVKSSKGQTLNAQAVQSAVKLLIPGELAKYAISEGASAVSRYATRTTA